MQGLMMPSVLAVEIVLIREECPEQPLLCMVQNGNVELPHRTHDGVHLAHHVWGTACHGGCAGMRAALLRQGRRILIAPAGTKGLEL